MIFIDSEEIMAENEWNIAIFIDNIEWVEAITSKNSKSLSRRLLREVETIWKWLEIILITG